MALMAIVLLLGSSQSFAADTRATAPLPAASKATGSKAAVTAEKKVSSSVKLVDINSAKSDELKKLPGISDAEAARIIAGRPYSSKADLAVRSILDGGVYESLKRLVIAKQPYKDAEKNAAIYGKQK